MSRMIKAAKFDKQITIQKRDYSREQQNGNYKGQEIWRNVATVRASIEPIQGREYFSGPFQMGENIIRVRIRYREGITNKMRLKYGKRVLDIYSVIDSREEHKELHLM